ncbi:MAG: hypothetical protein VKJ04_05605, partial [Vampirovibrionales bacterium]|nr:hypothetical protein [Vampirovibrionales bacterium]
KQELSDLDSRIANAQPGQARNQLYGERNILLERIKAAEAQQSVASTAANAADGPSLRNNPQVRDNGLEVVETIPARGTRSDKGGTAAPYVGAGTGLALSGVAPRALPDALATYNPYANYARPPMFAPQAASDFRIFNYNDPNGLPMPQSNGSLSYSG